MPDTRRFSVLAPVLLVTTVAAAAVLPAPSAGQETLRPRAASITFGGRLHYQFASSSVDGADSEFYFRRARFIADIRVNDFVSARLQPEFAEADIQLKDAYVRLAFDPAFSLTVGQFKRPFSTFELASSTDLPMIERDGRVEGLSVCPGVGGVCSFSRLTEKLHFDDRDRGVMASGSLGDDVSYAASLTNGEGGNSGDVNDAKSLTGRLEWSRDAVTVGVFGGLHDYLLPDTDETERAGAAGVDLELGTWRNGAHVLAALAFGDNWAAGEDVSFTAAQVLGSWYVPVGSPRLAGIEPMLRVGWADPDGDTDDDAGLLLTPGLVAYVVGKNGFSVNLDLYDPSGDADSEWSFKVKSFLYF